MSFPVRAQVNIVDSLTAAQLVQKVVGKGISYSNPVLNCPGRSSGSFTVISSNLGLDSGIVLSTGKAATDANGFGINSPWLSALFDTATTSPGDSDLTTLIGQPTVDACVLEFDFYSVSDTVAFDYVFASSEYFYFSCSQFNDAFALFLSGPGYPSPTNLAIIPGTNVPVTVNSTTDLTVNSLLPTSDITFCNSMGPASPYSAYYVNNTNGTSISFHGFTTVLTAKAAVEPCSTYHIKMAVADALDWLWDSGVFIKGGSFQAAGTIGGLDTVVYCGSGPGVTLQTSGTGTIAWTVLNGNAVLTGSGTIVMATATTNSRVTATPLLFPCAIDTFDIIVPVATLDAGLPLTIPGCGSFIDTLHANFSTTAPYLNHAYSWSPASSIQSGGNSLDPVITPSANTIYTITVATIPSQGGCAWTDTISVAVDDRSANADYEFDISYGCYDDMVQFQNLSTNATRYEWNFADNTGDTAANPHHIYLDQNAYTVRLIAKNAVCADTVIKIVDTQHPLNASFTMDDDTICTNSQVTFINTSTYTTINGPAKFAWSFGDGITDTTLNASHTYAPSGVYNARLIVQDFIPCADTAYATIIVDPIPTVTFDISDSILCEGGSTTFVANYTKAGNANIRWDFGTNTVTGIDQVRHAFDTAGSFTVVLYGDYRSCPDTSYTKEILIKPYYSIDLGADTSICPNADVIVLKDHKNENNGNAQWLWNTGDTTSYILARHHGIYTATVTLDGCSSSDSIQIFKDCYIDIPNSFTPNGDGINDHFLPRQLLSSGLAKFHMVIYDRWGQTMFETTATDGRGWDGKLNGAEQANGVYVYLIEAAFTNGTMEKYKGNVTLLR